MIEKLTRFDRHQKSMVFDFETCSLNLTSTANKPWQLAFEIYEGGKLIESNDYHIFWEDLKLSEGARRVTGFKDAKYKIPQACNVQGPPPPNIKLRQLKK